MNPKIVALLLQGHPQNRPPTLKNSHIVLIRVSSKTELYQPQTPFKEHKVHVKRRPKPCNVGPKIGLGLQTLRLDHSPSQGPPWLGMADSRLPLPIQCDCSEEQVSSEELVEATSSFGTRLGGGFNGEVFLGTMACQSVAVKVSDAGSCETKNEVLRRSCHPNIIALLGCYQPPLKSTYQYFAGDHGHCLCQAVCCRWYFGTPRCSKCCHSPCVEPNVMIQSPL